MSILQDLIINKNGVEQALSKKVNMRGLQFLDMTVSAPSITPSYLTNPGLDGQIESGAAVYGARTVSVNFLFKGKDLHDFELGCRAIHAFLFSREAFYIRSTLMPAMRYKVRAKPYETTRLSLTDMTFTVEFDLPSGFREAFQTTQEADFSNDAAAWPIGMNIPLDQPLFYTFKTNSFSVYNASEIVLNPLKHHLLDITLTCTGTPTITNKTTGDVFKLNKKMAASDTLLLNGCYPFLNGNRCGRDTNHGVITLAEGWNDFVLTGCENPVISFNTRFLYL
ncbi:MULTISPECIES: phage tail domain-containing protein [Bacillus]|uniref:phage tail domain-containing protein n=1 Tax=Bacillus TaxID=1386 RepID=UPI0019283789|nr:MULTISPECIES: phage tail domain-containing protein [Bacillus]MBL3628469.1 phage tail family protein [Bacillus sp. RHF6]MCZ4247055.1 phage tail family protein [Bacillus amyloliquefaciens]MED4526520.1 phage tail family protein [Bacillus velezensis]